MKGSLLKRSSDTPRSIKKNLSNTSISKNHGEKKERGEKKNNDKKG